MPGGVHHIEGGEVDAADAAAPDAATRLTKNHRRRRKTPHTGCKGEGQKPSLLFLPQPFCVNSGRRALAGTAATAYLGGSQVVPR